MKYFSITLLVAPQFYIIKDGKVQATCTSLTAKSWNKYITAGCSSSPENIGSFNDMFDGDTCSTNEEKALIDCKPCLSSDTLNSCVMSQFA